MELTKEYLDGLVDRIDNKMEMMELRMSRQITKEIVDTYWKIIPLNLGMMAIINGVFYVAYKMS